MKSVSSGQQAALEAAFGVPVTFAEVDWAEGIERYATAGADMTWNGYTWKGIGDVVLIDPVVESSEVESTAVRFTLAGVASSRISQALATQSQGRRATLWFVPLDPATNAIVDTPVKEFEGRLDAPAISETEQDGKVLVAVSITCESRMASLLGAAVRRYTNEDQQKFHAGDTFCQFAAEMAERLIVFPSREAQR